MSFVLTQHSRDISLMMMLADYLECGHCYTYKDYAEFKCRNLKDINEKILPLFLKHPILGVKSQDFEDGAKVAEIMNSKAHLTMQGLEQIKVMKDGMNRSRDNSSFLLSD